LQKRAFSLDSPPFLSEKERKGAIDNPFLAGEENKERKKERKKRKVKLADTLVHVFAFHSQLEGRERESRHNN